jgi:hypothetical protein
LSVKADMKKSSRLFLDIVWPAIHSKCGGGEIIPVETLEDSALAEQMDMLAGIDVWQTKSGEGCRGIASRVQSGANAVDRAGRPWNTFTIRRRRSSGATTEWEKRVEAIQTGRWLYPYLTVQAYVYDDKLLSAAVARTRDLFRAAMDLEERGQLEVRTAREGSRWAEFAFVPWDRVPEVWTTEHAA